MTNIAIKFGRELPLLIIKCVSEKVISDRYLRFLRLSSDWDSNVMTKKQVEILCLMQWSVWISGIV